jgi:hypothetical protein
VKWNTQAHHALAEFLSNGCLDHDNRVTNRLKPILRKYLKYSPLVDVDSASKGLLLAPCTQTVSWQQPKERLSFPLLKKVI